MSELMFQDEYIYDLSEDNQLLHLLHILKFIANGHNLHIYSFGISSTYFLPNKYHVEWITIKVNYERKKIEIEVMRRDKVDNTEEPKTELSRRTEEK